MTYLEKVAGLGELSLVTVDPDRHAALLHGWVTLPRNSFWGMGSHTVDEVREIYAFVDSLPT
ncbi:GNAT family N-acetyltransferase, partial [Micromonospora sp. NPDC002411]